MCEAKAEALICVFVFAYANCWFSHAAAHTSLWWPFCMYVYDCFHRNKGWLMMKNVYLYFMHFHSFHGFPFISWISIHFMDFHSFYAYPFMSWISIQVSKTYAKLLLHSTEKIFQI